MPRVLLPEWRMIQAMIDGVKLLNIITGMTVIASVAREQDGKRWFHVSCAHPERMPTWNELLAVKDQIIGRDKTALQVIPPRAKHVNIHPNCLHLWHCIDGDVTPDFTQGSGSL